MLNITLATGSEREVATKLRLEKWLQDLDLTKYIRCKDVLIEEGASGHSRPVIRLSAWAEKEHRLLAQFLHEQYHWIDEAKKEIMKSALEKIASIYPNVPIEKPEGGGSLSSTYIHLIVCRLEYLALKNLLDEKRATYIVSSNSNYTWIRKTIFTDGEVIDKVIHEYFPEVEW